MRNNILNALDKIAKDNHCHLLFACESGSRAWGFASMDSDYDVRFIYYNTIDWYLRIDDANDTINAMLPHDLDLCGWELKKVMTLFSKSNLCLLEWINSPEIYFRNEQFHENLKALIPNYFNPKKALHHYLSTANKIKEKHLESLSINIKKFFYILRPLLACCWIINNESMPPTEFKKLYIRDMLPSHIYRQIDELLVKKSRTTEKELVELPAELINWLEITLTDIALAMNKMKFCRKVDLEPLNELIRITVRS